jgi:hypothetical protein
VLSHDTIAKRIVLLNAKINKLNNLSITTISDLNKTDLDNERQKLLLMLANVNSDANGDDLLTKFKTGERGIVDILIMKDKVRFKKSEVM